LLLSQPPDWQLALSQQSQTSSHDAGVSGRTSATRRVLLRRVTLRESSVMSNFAKREGITTRKSPTYRKIPPNVARSAFETNQSAPKTSDLQAVSRLRLPRLSKFDCKRLYGGASLDSIAPSIDRPRMTHTEGIRSRLAFLSSSRGTAPHSTHIQLEGPGKRTPTSEQSTARTGLSPPSLPARPRSSPLYRARCGKCCR
jgi:hypothetical protein